MIIDRRIPQHADPNPQLGVGELTTATTCSASGSRNTSVLEPAMKMRTEAGS
jgi:hypothetical protein